MRGSVIRLPKDGDGRSKGFGFVRGEDNIERFFHRSAVADRGFDDLQEGDNVTFEESEGSGGKGPRAEDVERV